MTSFPDPVARLIDEFRKLPGIGSKSAQRLVFHLIARPGDDVRSLAAAITDLEEGIRPCRTCHQITDIDPCAICIDPGRDHSVICVVERPSDVLAVEGSAEFRGLYHVLQGVLNPLAGIGPESLTIESLEQRLAPGTVHEVILATNAGVEGEATASYLARRLAAGNLRITRPAQGMPAGSELEYTDRLTLARALRGRRTMD
ncbi:MAG: recombination protein RecR [Acidobacteria bacterium]|nr:MAG: recombination protein RecR [Acidobacteriota bacterium]